MGGIIAIYIRPIYSYGQVATKYLEEQTRRPSLERFIKEENKLQARISKDPNDKDAYLRLGWLYYRANKLNQANKAYQSASQLDPENPDPDVLLLQAIILGELGQSLQEEKTYEKLLELQPDNTEALINIGLVYMKNKLVDRANEKLNKAKDLLLAKVKRQQKKVLRQSKDGEEDAPVKEPPDLVNMKKHLGMAYYHLAVANQLLNEKSKSGRFLNKAKRYGIDTQEFSSDVERFRR